MNKAQTQHEPELARLVMAMQDASITTEQMAQLEARLKADPQARRVYLRFMQLHGLLEQFPPEEPVAEAQHATALRLPIPGALPWLAGVAALAVFIILGIQSLIAPTNSPPIATLLFESESQWASKAYQEGERLRRDRIQLKEGTVVIRFDGGAEVVLQGPADLHLLSAAKARLRHGEVIIRADRGADGFTLLTPKQKLVDLGTEFGVRVLNGATELHVHEGEVEVGQAIVSAGKAFRFEGKEAIEVFHTKPRFEDVIRKVEPRPRADLMSAYSGFHYPAGELPLAESLRGKGWAGPWRKRLPEERMRPEEVVTPDFLRIVHGQLNVTWPVPGGRLGMLEMPSGASIYVRELAKPISMQTNQFWYFSLMVRETLRTSDPTRKQEGLRLTFRSSEDYFGPAISFGYDRGFRPRIQVGGGGAFSSPLLVPKEQTMLWVGKVVARKRGEDEIHFRIYGEEDALDYAEPAAWHVVSRGADLSARLDRVLLTSHGEGPRIVDELRIGPTWRSVVPFR